MACSQCLHLLVGGSILMAIAKKAIVWGLFAAGGTLTSFVFPALIALFLLIATGNVPEGLQFEQIHSFVASWLGKACLFVVLFLSVWHAAHRLRVVAHDFGIRKDTLVANAVYAIAAIGTVLAAFYLLTIN
jgi:fumarate reductase subunit D